MISLSRLPWIFGSVYTYIVYTKKKQIQGRKKHKTAFSLGKLVRTVELDHQTNLLGSKDCLGNDTVDGSILMDGGLESNLEHQGLRIQKVSMESPSKSIQSLCFWIPFVGHGWMHQDSFLQILVNNKTSKYILHINWWSTIYYFPIRLFTLKSLNIPPINPSFFGCFRSCNPTRNPTQLSWVKSPRCTLQGGIEVVGCNTRRHTAIARNIFTFIYFTWSAYCWRSVFSWIDYGFSDQGPKKKHPWCIGGYLAKLRCFSMHWKFPPLYS